MLKKLLPVLVLLLLPISLDAAYKVYLKNGSAISGVSSYEKSNGEVTIYFGGGSVGVSDKDILRIEETGAPEKDFRSKETPTEHRETPVTRGPDNDRGDRFNALKAEYEAVMSEIRTKEEDEAKLVAAINEKAGRRFKYNTFQLKQLEKEIEPLQQELALIRQRKSELIQQKNSIEDQMKTPR